MKMKVSARTLGAVAPYVLSASGLFPISLAAPPTYGLASSEVRPHEYPNDRTFDIAIGSDLYTYNVDVARPDLVPLAIMPLLPDDLGDAYESFVASEGWHEELVLEGPFTVEEEPTPSTFFDRYDLSAIALYEE